MMLVRALTLGAAVVVTAAPAHATPAEGDVVRTDLATGATDTPISIVTDGPSVLSVQNLQLTPGSSSGWHSHPGPEYSAITAGSVWVQTAGSCVATQYGAGQAVFIPAGVVHRVANDGLQEATAVVTYTLPAQATARQDAADPCPH